MDTLFAQQGDTVDGLMWRERGLGADDLARVLAVNPGLAAMGPILPAGTAVGLPAAVAPVVRDLSLIQLWD